MRYSHFLGSSTGRITLYIKQYNNYVGDISMGKIHWMCHCLWFMWLCVYRHVVWNSIQEGSGSCDCCVASCVGQCFIQHCVITFLTLYINSDLLIICFYKFLFITVSLGIADICWTCRRGYVYRQLAVIVYILCAFVGIYN